MYRATTGFTWSMVDGLICGDLLYSSRLAIAISYVSITLYVACGAGANDAESGEPLAEFENTWKYVRAELDKFQIGLEKK